MSLGYNLPFLLCQLCQSTRTSLCGCQRLQSNSHHLKMPVHSPDGRQDKNNIKIGPGSILICPSSILICPSSILTGSIPHSMVPFLNYIVGSFSLQMLVFFPIFLSWLPACMQKHGWSERTSACACGNRRGMRLFGTTHLGSCLVTGN